MAYRFPDSAEEPDPFERTEPEHWPPTPAQRTPADHAVGESRVERIGGIALIALGLLLTAERPFS